MLILSRKSVHLHFDIIYSVVLRCNMLCTAQKNSETKLVRFIQPSFLLTFRYQKQMEPFSKKTAEQSQVPCPRWAEISMGFTVTDRSEPATLTSHLLSWVFLLSWMFQFSASTLAQWGMVMATGQKRSRPGGPYVTSGPRRISQPSSVWTLNTQWHKHTQAHKERMRHVGKGTWKEVVFLWTKDSLYLHVITL